jgi:lipoprotein-anchoring transpeptidase ErfK/SrfK
MYKLRPFIVHAISLSLVTLLTSCATQQHPQESHEIVTNDPRFSTDFAARLPNHVDTNGKKMVLVDPNVHAWGAYTADGKLIRAGIATAGDPVCPADADSEDCRTGRGTFHVTSMGGEDCYSKKYPRPHGGGLMPFCMYFNNGQALHGSPDNIVIEDNVSHGCVRMRIPDAEWMHNNFAEVGTKVVVMPY